jgi:hypothetical protein
MRAKNHKNPDSEESENGFASLHIKPADNHLSLDPNYIEMKPESN